MSVSYNKLWHLLLDKKMTKTELSRKAGVTSNVIANMGHDKPVRIDALIKISEALGCGIDDIMEVVPDKEEE